MVLTKCDLISSRRNNSIVANLGFTSCGRHALHSVRQVCEGGGGGMQHLSMKLERDAAKIMGEMTHLISNHLENNMHVPYRVPKIICSMVLSFN